MKNNIFKKQFVFFSDRVDPIKIDDEETAIEDRSLFLERSFA